jgi:hypothetical protein
MIGYLRKLRSAEQEKYIFLQISLLMENPSLSLKLSLERLIKDNKLIRLSRGIYFYPKEIATFQLATILTH